MDTVCVRLVDQINAESALRKLVFEVTGTDRVQIDHHCGRCGSQTHGRPVLRGGGAWLSLARAGGYALVGICAVRQVGVDLELADSVSVADLAAADIRASKSHSPTTSWVHAEAVGKAFGTGLVGTNERQDVTVVDLDLAPGLIAAIAVAGFGPVDIQVSSS